MQSLSTHMPLKNVIEHTFKKSGIKALFTPSVFEVLMSECRSVLSHSHRCAGNEMVQVSLQNKKRFLIC